jgi:predicted NUDIX family NTP pyrophosphohydrolase
LPPTSKEVEKTINDYSAIFFTNIAGSCFSAGDLIAKSNSGFCAGFDVTDNFGYLVEVDSNINKLKALIVGSVGTGSCLIIRKENNSWGIFATFYNSLEEKYSDSAKQFLDNSEIQTSNSTILNQYYSFKSGETGINYSYNSEIDIFNNNRSIIYLIDQSAIKSFEDVMNVGS